MRPEVLFSWPVGDRHGWGVRGAGYVREWKAAASAMDGVEYGEYWDGVVLTGLGNDLGPTLGLRGKKNIGCVVFEDLESVGKNVDRLRAYDAVVVASNWNRQVLEYYGLPVRLVHEGVNEKRFSVGVRRRGGDGRFRVFSGGKPEWRKAQDLVIGAFLAFAEKHEDAVLNVCWDSPFWLTAAEFSGRSIYGCAPGLSEGKPDWKGWLVNAGIAERQIEVWSGRGNEEMSAVYAGMDVGVFPNRCEGGTNFVAMELMACGVPAIVKEVYGQRDLAGCSRSVSWREGIDEIVAALEAEYDSPSEPDFDAGGYWNWGRHCREMEEIVADV